MNATERRIYWQGYHAMKRLALDYYDARRAFNEIHQSNASATFVAGARRALEYIQRVGLHNVTI